MNALADAGLVLTGLELRSYPDGQTFEAPWTRNDENDVDIARRAALAGVRRAETDEWREYDGVRGQAAISSLSARSQFSSSSPTPSVRWMKYARSAISSCDTLRRLVVRTRDAADLADVATVTAVFLVLAGFSLMLRFLVIGVARAKRNVRQHDGRTSGMASIATARRAKRQRGKRRRRELRVVVHDHDAVLVVEIGAVDIQEDRGSEGGDPCERVSA